MQLIVHYQRFDHDYEGLGLWTWENREGEVCSEREIAPCGSDDFGPVFHVEVPENDGIRVGLLPRLRHSWEYKDGADRYWTPSHGGEVWLVSGDQNVYTDRPDISPSVESAFLDGERVLTVRLTHALKVDALRPELFRLRHANGATEAVSAVAAMEEFNGRTHRVEVELREAPDLRHEVLLVPEGFRPAPVTPRNVDTDPDLLYSTEPMGAICADGHTVFRVFSPRATSVDVVVYTEPEGDAGRSVHPLERRGQGVWETSVWEDLHGRYYMLRIDAPGSDPKQEVGDVEARCVPEPLKRPMIVDPRRLDPPGFRPIRRPTTIHAPVDAIIYEMHVRDFSIARDSGAPDDERGRFAGAARRGTVIPGTNIATGIDHLVQLGVTHVQLLPIEDFGHGSHGPYNWGYMTRYFNAPETWYARDARGASVIREFKELVHALHEAGIRVIMDVVYNHTAHEATFDQVAPGYYLRRRPDGTLWNGSGTGNEFRSEAPMGRKFIVDSCLYWVREFGIDGFRFDLMGLIDLETMLAVRDAVQAVDPSILVYGEPWAATGPDGSGLKMLTYKDRIRGTGVGAFNDHFRNALKGAPDGDEPGYVQNGSGVDGVKAGIMGSIHDWAHQPFEAIQYADCHDNLCLWDKVQKSMPTATEEDWLRANMLAVGILAISQGLMFLHGGVEIGRTKQGNHNSYDAPDSINQFEWRRKQRYSTLFQYARGMIALRRAHRVFRLGSREEIEQRVHFRDLPGLPASCIGVTLDGKGLEGEAWAEAQVLINPTDQTLEVDLPEGHWKVFVQGPRVSLNPLFQTSKIVYISPRSLTLLAR